ncbi:MAG: non-canonical purine NTP pyrophosphatase [Gemmatimonadota bacterium]
MKLLVATRSEGKSREIRRILAGVPGWEVVDLSDMAVAPDPAEDDLEPYDTFEENAESKARYFADKTGLPTIADDSGIEIDVLDGAPGVRTKRFAADGGVDVGGLGGQALDAANNAHMVDRLAGVAQEDRTARYVCVAVFVEAGTRHVVCRGEAPGVIVDEGRGDGGFGYDPHVFVPELGRTFAELSAAEKDARSHRGAAFREFAAWLGSRGTRGEVSGGA